MNGPGSCGLGTLVRETKVSPSPPRTRFSRSGTLRGPAAISLSPQCCQKVVSFAVPVCLLVRLNSSLLSRLRLHRTDSVSGRNFRVLECPQCGEAIRTVGNSFFGVGLSTHRYVRVCSDCLWTEFIVGAVTEPIAIHPAKSSRWGRILKFVTGHNRRVRPEL
jgi:hypothetical protein